MNFENIALDSVKVCKSGKMLKLFQNADKKPLAFQSCRLFMPFGISKYENKWNGMYDYSVSCYVSDDFEVFMDTVDEKVKVILQDFTESEFQPSLKQNKIYPKLLRLKLPRDSMGNFTFAVFDSTGQEKIMITEDNVEEVFCKKTQFKCIMESQKIIDWSEKCSISWMLTQAKLIPRQEKEEECDFDLSDNSDAIDYTQCLM